jgi:type I restriction enzyme S subunit
VQERIGALLGVLDDKIAANTKLATAADELSRTTFQQLVADVPMSGLTFDDVADIGGGATPRSSVEEYWGGDVAWLTPTDVTSLAGPYVWRTARTITDSGLASCASPLYPMGTIFMTSRATIGAFALGLVPMAVNQGFIAVQPRSDADRFWLFHETRARVPEFLDHANGATFMELSRGNFKKLPVRWPDESVRAGFAARAGALHAAAISALRENEQLAATRDALLPALMSGRLSVADL